MFLKMPEKGYKLYFDNQEIWRIHFGWIDHLRYNENILLKFRIHAKSGFLSSSRFNRTLSYLYRILKHHDLQGLRVVSQVGLCIYVGNDNRAMGFFDFNWNLERFFIFHFLSSVFIFGRAWDVSLSSWQKADNLATKELMSTAEGEHCE